MGSINLPPHEGRRGSTHLAASAGDYDSN